MARSPMSDDLSLQAGPSEFESYLSGRGWVKSNESRAADVWSPERVRAMYTDLQGMVLVVPTVPSASDFDRRVQMVLQDLEAIEQRPAKDIRDEVSRQFVDVTDVSADHEGGDWAIPLDAGQKLFQSAKILLVSAGAATIRRRNYFGKSIPHRARDLANNVLVGHTRRGSYVVPVISRARLASATFERDEPTLIEPSEQAAYDRRTLVTLTRGLTTLQELAVVAERAPTNSQINDGVGEGLSYEMCKGVLRTLESQAVDHLRVGFNWSPAIPSPVRDSPAIEFPHEAADRVRMVRDSLRNDVQEREQVVYGWIHTLSSQRDDVGGRVLLSALVNDKQTLILMTLNAEDYEKARASHKRSSVMVRGDLHLEEGRRATMEVHHFELEQPLADFPHQR